MRLMSRELRLALAALALSMIFLGWSLFRAINPPAVAAAGRDALPAISLSEDGDEGRRAQIASAVDADLFNPARTRPAARYRLAHEMAETAITPQRAPLRWAGVVIAADPSRSFMSVGLGAGQNSPVQIVKVGEKVGDYTLKTFDYKSATFETASGELITINNPRKGIR